MEPAPAPPPPAQSASSSSSSSSQPTSSLTTAASASLTAAAPLPAAAPPPVAAHVLLPAFRPRVLALSNTKTGKTSHPVLVKLPVPTSSSSSLASSHHPPPSSLLWQRHAHGSYRSYYGARRQASSTTTSRSTSTSTLNPPPPVKSTTDARLSLLQPHWFADKDCLDMGTNTGKVAWEMYVLFKPRRMVGVDIDPDLIKVAREKLAWAGRREGGRKRGHEERVVFRCEDFVTGGRRRQSVRREEGEGDGGAGEEKEGAMKEVGDEAGKEKREEDEGKNKEGDDEGDQLATGLKNDKEEEEGNNKGEVENEDGEKYDVITCLSVTKHVHLQGGDAALRRLFHRVHTLLRPGGRFILEPQAWRTYRKRKHASVESQKNYGLLQLRPPFTEVLLEEVGFENVEELGVPSEAPVGYRRPIFCFVKRREEENGGRGEGERREGGGEEKEQ